MSRMIPGAGCLVLPPRRVAIPDLGADAHPNPVTVAPLEKALTIVAAIYDPTISPIGGNHTVSTGFFTVRSPGPRFRLSLTAGFELLGNKVYVAGQDTPTWQLIATRSRLAGGITADLDTIFVDSTGAASARRLPDGYEIDSAVREMRGTLTLHQGSANDLDAAESGQLIIEARWEPHDGVWGPDMIALLSQCDLRMQGAPVLLGVLP